MIRTISPKAMQAYEKKVMAETGLPGLLLMEHASRAVADRLDKSRYTVFLCGPGNNGGDGFAAARLFYLAGGRCEVWRLPGELKGDALTNWQLLRTLCPEINTYELAEGFVLPAQAEQVVDALFGTGLDRALAGLPLQVVNAVNESQLPVTAVDIPSGLSGLTGQFQRLGHVCFVFHTRSPLFCYHTAFCPGTQGEGRKKKKSGKRTFAPGADMVK